MSEPLSVDWLTAWERLTGDPDAGGAFVALVHAPLVAALSARHRRDDPDAVFTAVSDAVLAILKRPAAYDPAKSPLFRFLLMIAERRLRNSFAAEGRHRRGRIPWDAVELDASERNEEEEDEPLSLDAPELRAVIDALSDAERQVFDLMRGGERRTAVYAAVLGIADCSADEQEVEVKRAKDRIKARLKRAGGGS